MSQYQTLIIGGGIAGLVAARVMERRGFSCALIEQRHDLTAGGAGLMLWPSALNALTQLGFTEAKNLGKPVRESLLRDHKARTLLRIPLGLKKQVLPRAVSRKDLMHLLARDLRCELISQACTKITRIGEQYVVELADARTLTAENVIIANGMNSKLRQLVAKDAKPRECGACGRNSWRGLTAFKNAQLESGLAIETLGIGCRVGLFPAGNGLVYWFVQANQSKLSGKLASHQAFLLDFLKAWPAPILDIIAATPESAIIETSITEMLPAPQWLEGNILLVGDAAHGMAPDLGRGACAAIVNLREFDKQLSRHASFSQASAAYVRKQRRKTIFIQHASRIAGEVRQMENPVLYRMRNIFWRFVPPLLILRLIVAPIMEALFKRREK